MRVDTPERIWIESEGECPYFYHEEELSEVGSPVTEYVRRDKLGKLATALAKKDKEIAALRKVLREALADLIGVITDDFPELANTPPVLKARRALEGSK